MYVVPRTNQPYLQLCSPSSPAKRTQRLLPPPQLHNDVRERRHATCCRHTDMARFPGGVVSRGAPGPCRETPGSGGSACLDLTDQSPTPGRGGAVSCWSADGRVRLCLQRHENLKTEIEIRKMRKREMVNLQKV